MITNLNDFCKELGCISFAEAKRSVYNYTDCGAWINCDESGIRVGSIVEGTEDEVEPVKLTYPFSLNQYQQAVESVESEAQLIWMETHGCTGCNQLYGWTVDDYGPVHPDCEQCGGRGVPI